MKIFIPVDEATQESLVCRVFGRAPYFAVVDTDTEGMEFIENQGAQAQGGAGIKAAQQIVNSGANVILAPQCGQNAADVLQAGAVKMYLSINGTLGVNLKAYEQGGLQPLIEIHEGFHGGGSK